MPQLRSDEERRVTLSARERDSILSANPSFRWIERAAYFDNYDLPCPIRVDVRTSSGRIAVVVLRKTRHGDVAIEVALFRALRGFGLPVPEVLCGPFENENGERAVVYSMLPGESLQALSARSPKDLGVAKALLIEAVLRLTAATDFIRASAIGADLEPRSLAAELDAVKGDDNPWLAEPLCSAAVACLDRLIANVTTPLVLSNGDYQPGNFLAQDGQLTGFLDFELAAFQDPLIGFAKYPIYDLRPLSRTDLVETFLLKTGFSKEDYQLRLALGCLKTLKREIPVRGGDQETQSYRARVLMLLEQAIPPGQSA